MKRLLLISIGTLFLSGCVYHTPYGGYSHYSTVTPAYSHHETAVYPRYEERYVAPRRHSYEYREHHHHFRRYDRD